jgi:hypothetical protein
MKNSLLGIACAAVLAGFFFAPGDVLLSPAHAVAQEGWRGEFDDISMAASDAMSLTVPELEKLLTRCATLKITIETLDESYRKVYGKRLQMTRDLLQFMLDSKKAPSSPPAQ